MIYHLFQFFWDHVPDSELLNNLLICIMVVSVFVALEHLALLVIYLGDRTARIKAKQNGPRSISTNQRIRNEALRIVMCVGLFLAALVGYFELGGAWIALIILVILLKLAVGSALDLLDRRRLDRYFGPVENVEAAIQADGWDRRTERRRTPHMCPKCGTVLQPKAGDNARPESPPATSRQ